MSQFLRKLSERKFQVHLISFTLMILPPVFMYYAAVNEAIGWVWVLVIMVITGNLLAVLTR